MIGVLIIHVPPRSHPIDVPRDQAIFLVAGDCKKKIFISHILEGN